MPNTNTNTDAESDTAAGTDSDASASNTAGAAPTGVRGDLDRGDGSGNFLPKYDSNELVQALAEAYPEPMTNTELGDAIGASRVTAANRLEDLAEEGVVGTKKVGARGRVWWLLPESESESDAESNSASDGDGTE